MPVDRYHQELESLLREDMSSVLNRERNAFDELLAASGNRVVLFGAGNLGRKALACLRSIGIEPLAFADNGKSRWDASIEGMNVLSPQAAAAQFGESAVFLVTIWSEGNSFRRIQDQLRGLGCRNISSSASLRWKFSQELLPCLCQDFPHNLYKEAGEVQAAASLWSDEHSLHEYLNQVRWRALGDYGVLNPPVAEESYFPDSIFGLRADEIFVDCGAYVGDTAQRFIERRGASFQQIVAIEPDPRNFGQLQQWQASLPGSISGRITCHNFAVGLTRTKVRFDGAIGETGNSLVECVPLDEILTIAAPTYIKMDIEGAEIDALRGARRAISRNRPVLAVCVYHRQSDLWRIPQLISSLCADYKLFLRPHEADGWQSVCYAVPPDRLAPTLRIH